MRILLACPYSWDAPGGVQVHVRELGERLRARGQGVLVLAPAREPPREPWVWRVGKPLEVPYNRSTAPICPSPASAVLVRRAVERFRPDVIHAHEPLTPSTAMFAMRSGAAPVVATFHSGAGRSRLFDISAPLLRRVASAIDIRIAVSQAAAEFAQRRLGGVFRIVPNGTDIERFETAEPAGLPRGRRLLFVGRLHRRKGFRTAVAVFGALADRFPDLSMVVAGDGEERDAVESLPESHRDRLVLLGHVENRDIPPYYAACDVFLAPSIGGESFGIVLVEAMAAGLPVVASDIPGYREVVRDGRDGLLVPPGDPGAFVEQVARILEDEALAGRLRESGRARARGFSWDRVATDLEAIYEEATGGGSALLT